MLISKKRLWLDRFETIRKYYKSPKFAALDLFYSFLALFSNPYRVCRKFNQKKGLKEIYTYGETPFSTYEKIAELAGVKKGDTWIEMGSGRGRGCFWLDHFVGCKVIGVEWVPQFIRLSKCTKAIFRMNQTEFLNEDIRNVDLKNATFIYLYGLYPEIDIPKNVKVITTGEPLDGFSVRVSFWVRFPWGRTRAFVQEKI